MCRAILGGTGDDQRSPTRAEEARRRISRRIVVVTMADDIKAGGRVKDDRMGKRPRDRYRITRMTRRPYLRQSAGERYGANIPEPQWIAIPSFTPGRNDCLRQ